MRNQTSFRLTTTLLPSDTTAKTTQVINKLDSTGAKFYPTFTEETVVITNDDRTVMETTRAVCTNGVLTFVKRGLSDDNSATPVENRKLTWNPGSLCFITAGASDWIDKDDDITWTGDQTYTGEMVSMTKATYKGRLITEKGVEYPHFDSLEDLQAYTSPFGGMFAVVDSDGELYRYNAVEETWSVVTTSTPVQPAKASTTAIGTVRGATDTEFNNGTATGSEGELLVATPAQIQSITPTMSLNSTDLSISSTLTSSTSGASVYVEYTTTRSGWLLVEYEDAVDQGESCAELTTTGSTTTVILPETLVRFRGGTPGVPSDWRMLFDRKILVPVGTGYVKINLVRAGNYNYSQFIKISKFFYYG